MLTHGSLFSGIGGFDLGFERAGIKTVWQVEKNTIATKALKDKFNDVKLFEDVTNPTNNYAWVHIISGGDPCPIRSRARSIRKTRHPDMSGYFLTVVARCQPWWVLRENVPASDDKEFTAALELLGYRSVIISANSAKITAQNRERDFIVACNQGERFGRFFDSIPVCEGGYRYFETKHEKTPSYPVLTTHACRWDSRDGYIWDGRGIRVADSEERVALAGFPRGWLDGVSRTAVAKLTGNAIIPAIAEEIGRMIVTVEAEFAMREGKDG